MSKLILTLVLTLALFPWGAYAAVMTAAASPATGSMTLDQTRPEMVQPTAAEAPTATTVAQVSLCHGPALAGSYCHLLAALLPGDVRLESRFGQVYGGLALGSWLQSRSDPPLLMPPRFC